MKKFAVSLLASFAMFAHAAPLKQPTQSHDMPTFKMNVIVVEASQIESVCQKVTGDKGKVGCSKWDIENQECTIWVMPQRFLNDWENLGYVGHETMHCRYGHWHNKANQNEPG